MDKSKPEPTYLNVRHILLRAVERGYEAGAAAERKEDPPNGWRGAEVVANELAKTLDFKDGSNGDQGERQRVATQYSVIINHALNVRRIPWADRVETTSVVLDVLLVVEQVMKLQLDAEDLRTYSQREAGLKAEIARLESERENLRPFDEITAERNRLFDRVKELETYAATMDAREKELQDQVKRLNAARASDQQRLYHYENLLPSGSVDEDVVQKAGDALQRLCEEAAVRARVYKNDESVLAALNAGIATIRALLLAYGSKGMRTPKDVESLIDRISRLADLGVSFRNSVGIEVRAFAGMPPVATCLECGAKQTDAHTQGCRFWTPSAQEFGALPGHWRRYIAGLKDHADELGGRLSATKGSPPEVSATVVTQDASSSGSSESGSGGSF